MSEAKKIKEIPTTLEIGTGKEKEVLTHYISLKEKKDANTSIKQISSQFEKVHLEEQILDNGKDKPKKIYSLYVTNKDEKKAAKDEKERLEKASAEEKRQKKIFNKK